jgi:succinate dehydrogenase/fumarate reductase flavoprotein subunit
MDFRENPRGGQGVGAFEFSMLKPEAYEYLEKSNALFGKPIDRLKHMNVMAIDLYKKHGINLYKEPLEVAVCAQHNNGGLTGDIWWESPNVRHLFPIGEVNGSHGVYRPGGSALNSGQVGGQRAAAKIAHKYQKSTYTFSSFKKAAAKRAGEELSYMQTMLSGNGENIQNKIRNEFQQRMTQYGAHIRDENLIDEAVKAAKAQYSNIKAVTYVKSWKDIPTAYQNRHLCLSHLVYLEAIREYLKQGGGSRGSYMVMDPKGSQVLKILGDKWRYKENNQSFDQKVQESTVTEKGTVTHKWVNVRPIPREEAWFENVWADFVKGKVFD